MITSPSGEDPLVNEESLLVMLLFVVLMLVVPSSGVELLVNVVLVALVFVALLLVIPPSDVEGDVYEEPLLVALLLELAFVSLSAESTSGWSLGLVKGH